MMLILRKQICIVKLSYALCMFETSGKTLSCAIGGLRFRSYKLLFRLGYYILIFICQHYIYIYIYIWHIGRNIQFYTINIMSCNLQCTK